jgi:hypothetical protein
LRECGSDGIQLIVRNSTYIQSDDLFATVAEEETKGKARRQARYLTDDILRLTRLTLGRGMLD